MTGRTAIRTILWPVIAANSPPEAPQRLAAMVVKQVTVHGLASQPNRPDAIRQALKDFEDDLHAGHVFGSLCHIFIGAFLLGYDIS